MSLNMTIIQYVCIYTCDCEFKLILNFDLLKRVLWAERKDEICHIT